MKYLIASDIHGSLYYTKILQELIEEEKPDSIILLGDLYYHGPRNPLPKEYNPAEVCKILNSYKDILHVVKGNCDSEVDEMISEFNFYSKIKLEINNKQVIFTHGHKHNVDNPIKNCDVLIYGHFHKGYILIKDNVKYINIGSVSLPKNRTSNSYAVIENSTIYLKDLNQNIINKIEI